ncbi:MAG: ParB/RepB/Spo0J family partition protein [Trueperaceae bacterium]|nr:ParB/RepB/Spo0J family partition protein [Trueperaceae bacterium]MCW5820472.1 ParB/RepB/Spo0J family partition protein [Trueperaceae bacterium]
MAKKRKNELDRAAVFGAILGEIETSAEQQSATGIGLADLRYNSSQPRKHFDDATLSDLAESIRERGVLEPIIVRRVGTGYEVVAGERRARAARMAGLSEVPAVIVELDDREALEIAITENLQREDLNAVEETEAVLGLLELVLEAPRADVVALLQALYGEERGRGGSRPIDRARREQTLGMFKRLGRFSVSSFVSNRLPILEFPPELLDAVRSGQLAFTKAQAIARLDDRRAQRLLLAEAVGEDLSLSQIRRRITELRQGDHRAATATAVGVPADAQRLVTSTKRLLNRRRLAGLGPSKLGRVTELLDELNRLLIED